jgi:hypothetical protein
MANKPRELTHSATSKRVMTFATAVALVSVSLYAAPAAERIHLAPRFVAGQILRYQIEKLPPSSRKPRRSSFAWMF